MGSGRFPTQSTSFSKKGPRRFPTNISFPKKTKQKNPGGQCAR